MTDQLELTEDPTTRARRSDPDTSHDAAARAPVAEHNARILRALGRLGGTGGTYHEIAAEARLEPVAVNRRLAALRKLGVISRLEQIRPTPAGREAHVYVLTRP